MSEGIENYVSYFRDELRCIQADMGQMRKRIGRLQQSLKDIAEGNTKDESEKVDWAKLSNREYEEKPFLTGKQFVDAFDRETE